MRTAPTVRPILALLLVLLAAAAAAQPPSCDVDADGDVDVDDVQGIIAARNQPATGTDDARDADGEASPRWGPRASRHCPRAG